MYYGSKGLTTFTQTESLVLRDLFMRDFALTRLKNLHHFTNLRENFRFDAIWQGRSVAATFCHRLAGSDVTVTPSVTCVY
jgi:hypothetical protein